MPRVFHILAASPVPGRNIGVPDNRFIIVIQTSRPHSNITRRVASNNINFNTGTPIISYWFETSTENFMTDDISILTACLILLFHKD